MQKGRAATAMLLQKMNISLNGCEWVKKCSKTITEDAVLTEDNDLTGQIQWSIKSVRDL